MKNFFLLALAGAFAQLVDGALGMAYGVSSTTVLLAAGAVPAAGLGGLAGSDGGLRRAGGGHISLHTRDLRPQQVRVQEERASSSGQARPPRVPEPARVRGRVPRRLRRRWVGSHRDADA